MHDGDLPMPKKTSVQQRLDKIRKNKQRLKDALATLPRAPPVLGLPGRVYNLALSGREPLVDAASIAFQNELQLAAAADLLNRLEMDKRPISQPEAIQILMQQGKQAASTGEELLQVLSDDDFADTPLIDAVVEDVQTGRDVIRGSRQFDLQNLLPRTRGEVKRTRKKTKTDKNMSKALRLSNERFRKKNGSLRKGATQTKIMKYAHKLLRKM